MTINRNLTVTFVILAVLGTMLFGTAAVAQNKPTDLVVITADRDRAPLNVGQLLTGMEVLYMDSPLRVDGAWLFGIEDPKACATALFSWTQIREDNTAAEQRIAEANYSGARDLFEINRGRMKCLGEPAIGEELWKAYFLEGLSEAFQDQQARAMLAWELALVMEPNIPYPDAKYGPKYKRMYEQAKGRVIAEGGKAKIITTPKDTSETPGSVWIDGKPTVGITTEVYAGTHLVQIRGTDGKIRGFVQRMKDGDILTLLTPEDAVSTIRKVDQNDRLEIAKWLRLNLGVRTKQVAFHDGKFDVEVLESGNVLSQQIKRRIDAQTRPLAVMGGAISYYALIGYKSDPVYGANDQHNLGGVFWFQGRLGKTESPLYLHLALRVTGWDVRAYDTNEVVGRRLYLQPTIGLQVRLPVEKVTPQFGVAAHFLPGAGQETSEPLMVAPVGSMSIDISTGPRSPLMVRAQVDGGVYLWPGMEMPAALLSVNLGLVGSF